MSARKRQRNVKSVIEAGSTNTASSSVQHREGINISAMSTSANGFAVQNTTTAAPMSAMAARKAALAQQNALQPAPLPSLAQDTDSDDSASSAESEAASDEQPVASTSSFQQPQRQRRSTAPTRYYHASSTAGSARASAEESPVQAGQDADDQDLDNLENAQIPNDSRTKMGRGKRQRREKSAFLDPSCISNFNPNEGDNLFRVTLPLNGHTRQATLLCLCPDEHLIIHGSFGLSVLSGEIEVLGARLAAKAPIAPFIDLCADTATDQHNVFAPSSHPLPVIHARPASKPANATLRLPNTTSIDTSKFAAIIMLHDHNPGIEGIEKVLQNAGMGCANNMWTVPEHMLASIGSGGKPKYGGNGWRLITEATPTLTSMRRVDDWYTALSVLQPKPRRKSMITEISMTDGDAETDHDEEQSEDEQANFTGERLAVVVEGPKRAGKSTFTKIALNTLLNTSEAVAYLDTDLGQPEFTTPGFVSLSVIRRPVLGPSFTHLTIPVASHYLGSTSPASDPSSYSAAVASLIATYHNEVEFPMQQEITRPRRRGSSAKSRLTTSARISNRIPLIVNTQGWVKGLGGDLLTRLKTDVRPTHVFTFDCADDDGPDWRNREAPPTSRLSAAPSSPLESKWSAADLRTLAFISYFHGIYPHVPDLHQAGNIFPDNWDFEQPLVARTPFALNWRSQAQQLDSVHILHDEIAYEQVLQALNSSVVSVGLPQIGSTDSESSAASPFPYRTSSQSVLINALGLAIVRSVDPSTTTVHLITPLAASHLSNEPITLVKGSIDLPVPLMLDYLANEVEAARGICGSEWKDVPYLSVDGAEASGRRKVRRNLMRRGQA